MDDFPSNSQSPRKPALTGSEKEEPNTKKIEKVIEGEVLRRKKPLGKRFAEIFVGGDARSVGQYIAFDILLPATKDTIADVFSQGIERMLFGEARSSSRRNGQRPGQGYTNYQRYSSSSPNRDKDRWSRGRDSRTTRTLHNFDEIILATRVEAEEVIDRLFDLVNRYECATVADLYELVGLSGSYTDDKWGWTDLRGAGVDRVRNGYLLDLPKPEPLD